MSDPPDLPSVTRAELAAFFRQVPTDDWLVAAWVLATKLSLFVFGIKSFQALEDKRVNGAYAWLELWNRWDALHYQKIAQFGYKGSDVANAFYPLYPWLVRFVAYVTGDYFVSALIVSGVASLAAAIFLRRLVQLDYPANVAMRTVWFFLIFPTAYFLHIGYTEGLFLALGLGCILAARTERWWLAGVLGAFCWMSRAPGAVLVPTLAVEAAHQYWVRRRWNWSWMWIAIIPTGFAIYLLVNWYATGNALAFVQTRKAVFIMSTSWPWVGIREAWGNLHRPPNQAEMVGAQELYFVALGFVCLITSWIKLRPLYAMWITGSWLLFTSVTFIQSVPRYTLTLFPIFILFALLSANRFWNFILTMWSLLFLGLFVSLFVRGWWAF